VRAILSFHDFQSTPPDAELNRIVEEMTALGADVAKIAVMPRDESDVLQLLGFTLQTRRRRPELVLSTMAMGPLGRITRVAGFLFGADLAYAAGVASSAAGQIPLQEARLIVQALLRGD
jgi:3-dehydroquinate dehydratase-1